MGWYVVLVPSSHFWFVDIYIYNVQMVCIIHSQFCDTSAHVSLTWPRRSYVSLFQSEVILCCIVFYIIVCYSEVSKYCIILLFKVRKAVDMEILSIITWERFSWWCCGKSKVIVWFQGYQQKKGSNNCLMSWGFL